MNMIVAVVMETRAARWRKCEKDVEVVLGDNDGGSEALASSSMLNHAQSFAPP